MLTVICVCIILLCATSLKHVKLFATRLHPPGEDLPTPERALSPIVAPSHSQPAIPFTQALIANIVSNRIERAKALQGTRRPSCMC